MKTNNIINDAFETIKARRKIIYRPPLPLKKQRVTARGRSGKPRKLSPGEIFVYKCQKVFKSGRIEWLR